MDTDSDSDPHSHTEEEPMDDFADFAEGNAEGAEDDDDFDDFGGFGDDDAFATADGIENPDGGDDVFGEYKEEPEPESEPETPIVESIPVTTTSSDLGPLPTTVDFSLPPSLLDLEIGKILEKFVFPNMDFPKGPVEEEAKPTSPADPTPDPLLAILSPSSQGEREVFRWSSSSTRQEFLISLGVPVNLDEIHTPRKGRFPSIALTTSVSESSRLSTSPSSRSGTSESQPPPPLVISQAWELAALDQENLQDMTVSGLIELKDRIEGMILSAIADTRNALDAREQLLMDAEMHHKVIECLVDHAQKKREKEGRDKKPVSLKQRLSIMTQRVKTRTPEVSSEITRPGGTPQPEGKRSITDDRRLSM